MIPITASLTLEETLKGYKVITRLPEFSPARSGALVALLGWSLASSCRDRMTSTPTSGSPWDPYYCTLMSVVHPTARSYMNDAVRSSLGAASRIERSKVVLGKTQEPLSSSSPTTLPPHLPFGALSTSHRGYCKVFLRNYTCATYDWSTLSLPSAMLLRLHVDPCTLLATSSEHSVLVVVIGGLKSH